MDIYQLSDLTISELVAGYRDGSIDPAEVMEITLQQHDQVSNRINAIYDLRRDDSISAATAAAKRYRAGQPAGSFDGVPVSIKDSVHAVGMTWHHGAKLHGPGVVGSKDAPPTEKLKRAGAIIFGKATMPDFGLSASGVSSYHGIVRNPWGLGWNTGGSSAGAGASVAACVGMMSVGSDIAGSVRLPASHCGLAAIKPTQGMIPHTPSSDVRSAGPMVRYAADLEPALRILGGIHPDDRFSLPVLEPTTGFETATVAVYHSLGFGPQVEEAVLTTLQTARQALAGIVGQVIEGTGGYDFDAYLPIDDSLKLRGWREYSGAAEQFRAEVPAPLLEWFREAKDWGADRITAFQAGLARGVAQTGALFSGADFLLTPVMPVVNFPAESLGVDPAMPLRHCTFTAPFNQSGHPAVSICAGFDKRGLPIGIQLVAKRFDDIRLCRLATSLEQAVWSSGGRPAWPIRLADNQGGGT